MSSSIVNSCKGCDGRCCKGLAVVLTIPEAVRLVKALGKKPEEMLECSCEIDSKETPHYPILVKSADGVKEYFIIVKRGGQHECRFLGSDNRCSIYKDRPHVCRLYPFMLDGKTVKKKALCPVKFEKDPEMPEMAELIGKDMEEHGKLARKWSAQNAAKGKVPDMKNLLEEFEIG
jgi:Fe-S-cluster containining protein